MITGFIVFVFVVAMIAAGDNGEWGSVAVGAVIVILLIALASAGGKVDRAYGNFVDHWANEDRRKRRR